MGGHSGTYRRVMHWVLPPRFLAFLAILAVAVPTLGILTQRWGEAVLGGFDLAALVFIVSLWPLSRDHTPAQMRAHAQANDTNRLGVLVITSLVMVVIVTALAVDVPYARTATGAAKGWAMVMILASLVIAWLFSNLVYALHYAHMFYRDGAQSGFNFPLRRGVSETDTHCPDFWDFIYFSTTIGMAFATSDVEITRSDIRRIATVHGIAAFFYNLIVLAFTINVTAGS